MAEKTHTEYRLVLARPPHQEGRRFRYVPKRDWEHARDGLADHAHDMNRYALAGSRYGKPEVRIVDPLNGCCHRRCGFRRHR